MSLSKSANFEHAQTPRKCYHCGKMDDVNNTCLICEVTMCPTCKAIHNKVCDTRDHQVVRQIEEKGSILCEKHPDQKTSFHCDTCSVPVSTVCVTETHYGHQFSDISKILQSFKRDIEDSKMEMETRMNEINLLTQRGDQSWKDYENNVMNIKSRISNDAVTLHHLVDKTAQKRQDELNNIKHQDRTTWETNKDRLDKEKSKIATCLAQHDKCLSSTTTTGIAELLDESKILRSKQLNPIEVVPPSYQSSSNTSIEGIGEIIKQSKILSISHKSKLKEGKAEVISAFSNKLEGNPSICYAGNGIVLIGTDKSKDIHTVNSRGTIVHKRKRVLKDKYYSLAVAYSGDILVSPILSTGIKILGGQNKLKTLFETSAYKTRFVTFAKKQEILVCLIKLSRREGRVILCDSQGGNQRRIGSDDLYLEPMQAVQLQDGGFCISDYGKQQLVLLSVDGNVRHIIQNPLGRGQFWPRGICTDKAGNILASDHCNDCVYVIGEDMSVRELVGRTEGIIEPMCLCVGDDNNVWIAQFNGEIKVIKYLEDKYIL